MEVKLQTPHDLFGRPVRYVVPQYQRRYVWGQEEQWEPLWADVLNLAVQLASGRGRRSKRPQPIVSHFLGSIVIQPIEEQGSQAPTFAIVDGQQRLFTLQLLLDAAQQECEARSPEIAKQLAALVLNGPEFRDNNADHDFKVWPTDSADQVAFRHAMRNELPTDEYEKERIVEGHAWFADEIGKWLDDPRKKMERQAKALYCALTTHLQLAAIELGADDDEQVIFETLNSRGTPLGTFELAKNFLQREAVVQDEDPVSIQRSHLSTFDLKWWAEPTGSGRSRRPHVEAFLHHWLTMEKAQEIPLARTFPRFRDHVAKERQGQIVAVAEDLSRFGIKYKELRTADAYEEFGDFVRRWKVLQADVFTPLILWLWANGGSNQRVRLAYRHIESYLVRRLICSLDTRGYGAITHDLLRRVRESDNRGADRIIREHLAVQDSPRERWPKDSDVVEALVHGKLLGPASASRTRMILEAVELSFKNSDWRNRGFELAKRPLSVEHIMPRHWQTADWAPPKPRRARSRETAEQARNRLLHSIGNLTLVNRRYNSRLSTAAWTRKRELYEEDPEGLSLNTDLLRPSRAPSPTIWNEEEIMKRSERLAKRVIKIWPRPK